MSRLKSTQADTSNLPRWVREPWASDFASNARLQYEAESGDPESGAQGLGTMYRPLDRLTHAVELAGFGDWDHWPTGNQHWMHWPGKWMPGKPYDPAAYEVAPDGPPEELRQLVDAWQAEQDETHRALLRRNGWLRGGADEDAAVLRLHGVPPEPL